VILEKKNEIFGLKPLIRQKAQTHKYSSPVIKHLKILMSMLEYILYCSELKCKLGVKSKNKRTIEARLFLRTNVSISSVLVKCTLEECKVWIPNMMEKWVGNG
jgi:hypothetical protein